MIEAKNLCKSFNGRKILNNINAKFEQGKCNLIIGKSGSGKTVLMKCLVGLFEIETGNVIYNDRVFSKMSFNEMKVIRKEIGMLFQGGALFDSMNVEENIIFPLRMFTNMTLKEKIERANFCLSRVNLENVNKLFPSELSGGMKKRVAIARAIVMQPNFLFCDEPNSGLDPYTGNVIDNLISEITYEYNITTIINTHDINSVVNIGDKIGFIHEGNWWWEGDKENVLESDNKELDDFIFSVALTKKLKKSI